PPRRHPCADFVVLGLPFPEGHMKSRPDMMSLNKLTCLLSRVHTKIKEMEMQTGIVNAWNE
ncbi:MAG: hypothetical protein KDE58_29440, partial [Caldilineaceae bacterium]|nr:hypothetical protein [Caldilineaceae bacterium]